MKKLILLPALFIALIGKAQSYQKIEISHFKGDNLTSKTIKYTPGIVKISDKTITVDDKEYTIARTGATEAEDELYTSREYLCIYEHKGSLKPLKIVLIYTPKKLLCDLIVKSGKTSSDYCFTDK